MQRHKGGGEGEIAVEVSKTIEEQRSVVAGVSHCAPLAAVIIRHDKLQAQLEQLLTEHADDVAGRASAYRREECPVCLDEIGHGGDLMLTRCGHTYHVDCLLETLADGSVRSCPLCRTEIAQIPDHGTCSGKVFAFMCLLRIAFDRAQAQTQRCELPRALPLLRRRACPRMRARTSSTTATSLRAHCRGPACGVYAQVDKSVGEGAEILHARRQEAELQPGRQRSAARAKTDTRLLCIYNAGADT